MTRPLAILILSALTASAATLQVGPGKPYATIQSAVAAATAGDIVDVFTSTYAEAVTIDKALALKAAAGQSPVLVGSIEIAADSVAVGGLEVKNWNGSAPLNAINASGYSQIAITNCWIHDATNLTVAASSSCIYLRNGTRWLVDGCSCGAANKGVNLAAAHSSDATYANGALIQNCIITNNPVDGIDIHGQYITVQGNSISNNLDSTWASSHPDGIQCIKSTVDGYTDATEVLIYRNIVRNHTQNIFTEMVTNCYVVANLACNEYGTVNGVSLPGISCKNLSANGDLIYVWGNTFGQVIGVNVILDTSSTRCEVKGNIFHMDGGGAMNFVASNAVTACDYNLYYNRGGDIISVGGVTCSTASQMNNNWGWEAHGKTGDALVLNWYNTGQIGTNSPAYHSGTDLSPYTLDLTGTARVAPWDMGCYSTSRTPTSTLTLTGPWTLTGAGWRIGQ